MKGKFVNYDFLKCVDFSKFSKKQIQRDFFNRPASKRKNKDGNVFIRYGEYLNFEVIY